MRTTRRTYLVGVATGVAGSLAGCFGGGGSGNGSEDDLSAPMLGDPEAEVVVKTWEDFRCPHCKRFHLEAVPKLEENYTSPGTIRFERHDYPIPMDNLSWSTAVAARSVQAQAGDEAFFTFTEKAYENQSSLSMSVIRDAASAADADPDKVEADAESGEYRPIVQDDRQAGQNKGVSSTPSVFVNDEPVASRYEDIETKIEMELS